MDFRGARLEDTIQDLRTENEALRKRVTELRARVVAQANEWRIAYNYLAANDRGNEMVDLQDEFQFPSVFAAKDAEIDRLRTRNAALAAQLTEVLQCADALRKALEEWEQCARYDTLMEGPRFKGWDRSHMERCRKRMEAARAEQAEAALAAAKGSIERAEERKENHMDKPAPVPIRKYTCEKGHTFNVRGTWTTLNIAFQEEGSALKEHSFNYCMICFGIWAQKNFPMECEVVEEKNAALPRDPS